MFQRKQKAEIFIENDFSKFVGFSGVNGQAEGRIKIFQ